MYDGFQSKKGGQQEGGERVGTTERRQKILKVLCLRRYDTYDNLAREFNVCERTIRYDIASLMRFYPIETVRGHGGGVKVADGFYLYRNAKNLTPKQYNMLKKLSAQLDGEDLETLNSILSKFAP